MKENSKAKNSKGVEMKENSANLANSAKSVNLKANSSENLKENLANSKPNFSQNSNSGSNFSSNLKAIFALPKWAKVFLVALTALAAVGLGVAFSLKIWASDKIEVGEIVLKGIDKGAQERLDSGFAYQNRLYFQRLDFLLRSKVIAYIDIQGISWAEGVDKNAVTNLESHNRWVKFATTQDLISQGFNGKNLGQVSYKMDFSPFIKTITKYYLIVALGLLAVMVLYRFLWLGERGELKFSQKLLANTLWQCYKNINPLYRHTFWIVFIALNLVFGYHTVQFLWGNHDWGSVYGRLDVWNHFSSQGRYTQNLIHLSLLQDGRTLPFFNNIIGFASLALGIVLLCVYLKIPQRLYIWAVVGLLLALQPFTLARMYYVDQFAGLFVAFVICMLGFILAKRAGESATKHPYILCFLTILCFHWCIASYQVFLNTFCILLCGGLIATLIDEKCNLKTALYKFRFAIIAVAFAAISYKIVIDLLKKFNKFSEIYNNQMISLGDLPERILLVIKTGFGNLINFNIAFMPLSMTLLFAAFTVLFLLLLFASKLKFSAKIWILILACGAVVGSQIHNAISLMAFNYDAIHFNGLAILRVLFVVLAFKLCFELIYIQNLAKNLLFALSCVLIWWCAVQDLYAQKLHKLAFDFEMRLLNRVVDRLEQNENFSYDKRYCGLMLGNVENMRHKLYGADKHIGNEEIALIYHTFLGYPRPAFKSTSLKDTFTNCDFYGVGSVEDMKKPKIPPLIKRLDKAGILDTLQPFPHKNSVVVFEDIIVFVASKINLDEIRATIKALETQEIQAQNEDKERQDSQSEKSQEIQKDAK